MSSEADDEISSETPPASGDELARLRRELDEARARVRMLQGALEALPVSINIRDTERAHWYVNPAALESMRVEGTPEIQQAERAWQYFTEDGEPFTADDLPTSRALRGEGVSQVIARLRVEGGAIERWLEGTAAPILGEAGEVIGAVNLVYDISERRRAAQALHERTAELQARDLENAALIEQLERLVRQLSAPALEVWSGVLVVPLIGALDARRGRDLLERTLEAVTRRSSRVVIVDVTGAYIESAVAAEQLSRLHRALRLLGARCVLAGVRPALARFLVEHELAPPGVEVFLDLARALSSALESAG